MFNGEVVRLDAAIRMAPRLVVLKNLNNSEAAHPANIEIASDVRPYASGFSLENCGDNMLTFFNVWLSACSRRDSFSNKSCQNHDCQNIWKRLYENNWNFNLATGAGVPY